MATLKTCSKCKQQLELALFNKRQSAKDGLQNWCKQCHRSCQNKYYKNDEAYKARVKLAAKKTLDTKRDKLLTLLSTKKCVICGESDPIVLEFDHIDPTTKRSEVGTLMRDGYSWEIVEAEIAKCQVLCSNCHKRKTARDNNWYKHTQH
jgi:hypothetical protein